MELKFQVSGMTCAACSARVEKVTSAVSGVRKSEVNLLSGSLTVDAIDDCVSAAIITAVQNAGYGIENNAGADQSSPIKEKQHNDVKARIVFSAAFLLILMYFTMGHMLGLPIPAWYHGTENALVAALLQMVLTLPVVYLNRSYYSKGFKSLLHRAPNMDSLIAVGSSAELVYGLVALFRMAYAVGHNQLDVVDS